MNESKGVLHARARSATILSGTGIRAFTADIGISANRRVRTVDGRRQIQLQTSIADLGDLRTYGALRTIDGTGLMAAPLWDPSLKEGQEVDLPDWSKQPSARTIAPGQSAEIVLMRPSRDPVASGVALRHPNHPEVLRSVMRRRSCCCSRWLLSRCPLAICSRRASARPARAPPTRPSPCCGPPASSTASRCTKAGPSASAATASRPRALRPA